MKRFFTLSIAAMMVSLAFGQTVKSVRGIEKSAATSVQKEVFTATGTTQHKVAPNAEATATEVVATSASAQYYSSDGDWYCVLVNSEYSFRFDVVTNSPDSLEIGHVYTLADMDEDYSYMKDTSSSLSYTAATFVAKRGVYGVDYEATATVTTGQSYHITYTATAAQEYDVEITTVSSKYCGSPDYDWFFILKNDDYEFRFDVVNQEESGITLDKEFSLSDMIAEYSWGKNSSTGASITYKSATFKATKGANGTDYKSTVVDTQGNTYNITYTTVAPPEPTDTVVVEFTTDETNLVDATTSQKLFQFQGAKDNGFEAYVALSASTVAGSYTFEDVASTYTAVYLDADDEDGVACIDLKATVTELGENVYKAEIDYLGENAVLYKMTFNYGSVPTAITDVTTTKAVKTVKVIENGQVYIIAGDKKYNAMGVEVK